MSLYKAVQYGKERRISYTNPKAYDYTCCNHGSCSYCRDGRLFQTRKEEEAVKEELRDFRNRVKNSAEFPT